MKVYFLRHGKAEQASFQAYPDDSERPLTKEGIAEMKAQSTAMKRLGIRPEIIITSPYIRARQTADLVAEELNLKDHLTESGLLRCGAGWAELEELIIGAGGVESIMLVGHEPDFSYLIGQLIAPQGAAVAMKKGGLALVDVNLPLRPGRGLLRWLLWPKFLL